MSHRCIFFLTAAVVLINLNGEAWAKAHFLPDYRENKLIFSDDRHPDFPDHGNGNNNNDNDGDSDRETDESCPPYLLTESDCLEAGQIPDTSAPTCRDDTGIHYTSCRCGSEYINCENNSYGDPDSSCTDSSGTKYKNCLCDRKLFPKSEADCRKDMGPNARLFLSVCRETISGTTTIYGNSCGCTPSCPPSHPYQNCGDKTSLDKISDGCTGYCYKCL